MIRRWIIMLFVALSLSACAGIKGYPDRSSSNTSDPSALQPYLNQDVFSKYDADDSSVRNGMTREHWRNEVLEARIHDINLHFDDFQQSLYEQGVGFGIGTDWLVLGLSGGGAVAAKGVANALSAAAAGVTGARASYDKEALYNKTLIVLLGQMVAQRQAVLVTIRNGEKQDASQYPLTRGLTDVDAYYNAGTIPGALTAVAENSGAQSKQAQIDLTKLNTVPIVGAVSPATQSTKNSIKACIQKLDAPTASQMIESLEFAQLEVSLNFAVPPKDKDGHDYSPQQKLLYINAAAKTDDQLASLKSIIHCFGS